MATKALVIEDQERMGWVISQQLTQMGWTQIDQARSVTQALERISAARNSAYDLILCDYNLGDGTNGQQLLELLRVERRIPRRTSFIMVTAEASYAGVASAVELVPDAYLLKPFTQDGLAQRVQLADAKRKSMKEALAALDIAEPDHAAAIAACNRLIIERDRFALEALKVKGECLLAQGAWNDAIAVYEKVIAWRPTPWAEVGRARGLRHAGYPEVALEKLKAALESFPQFVAAYDELASLVQENGDARLAQQILEKAHSVVPSNRRTRELGVLALKNGDLESAARHLKVVTDKDRYGLLRSTEDFFGLASAQRQLKRPDQAMETLESIKAHFPESRPLSIRRMAAEALTLKAANRPFDAKKRVLDALEMHAGHLEPRTQMELAEACHACGDEAKAREILVHVAENWNEHPAVVTSVKETFARIGREEEGARLVDDSAADLVELNNRAAQLLRQGHLDEAVDMIVKVAKRLPNHATVQANAAQALLLWVEHQAPPNLMSQPLHAKPRQFITLAREHLRNLAHSRPDHARIAPLHRLFAKLTGENLGKAAPEPVEEEPASMEIGP
ncbi:MAG: response regulator [Zoogloea sp.]|nr:response regulator [Zoogloea sp.]